MGNRNVMVIKGMNGSACSIVLLRRMSVSFGLVGCFSYYQRGFLLEARSSRGNFLPHSHLLFDIEHHPFAFTSWFVSIV